MAQTMGKSISEIILPVSKEIAVLDQRLEAISAESHSLSVILSDIFKAGGKRIRPALSFLSTGLIGKEINEEVYLVSEISELIHTASLVHDDIIDNSLVRRGKPSANSKWDNAVTVISGDFMFARAAVNLGKLGVNDITSLFAGVLSDLCDGEIRQVEKKFSTELDWDYYYLKTFKKTASLFEASTKAPAIAYSMSPEEINACANFGKNLGMAFQIVDDILDYTASSEDLGKPAFADLKEGQITLPVLFALEDPEHGSRVKISIEKLASGTNADNEAPEVFEILQSCGAIEKSFAKAKEYADAAKADIKNFPDSIYKEALEQLCDFVVLRSA